MARFFTITKYICCFKIQLMTITEGILLQSNYKKREKSGRLAYLIKINVSNKFDIVTTVFNFGFWKQSQSGFLKYFNSGILHLSLCHNNLCWESNISILAFYIWAVLRIRYTRKRLLTRITHHNHSDKSLWKVKKNTFPHDRKTRS